MGDRLSCNISRCNAPVNGQVWVTRCLHVFCNDHGSTYFYNNKTQINCPVCSEINVRESDTLLCHSNPNDMVLAGVRPEKIIRIVEKCVKLWRCQLEAERKHDGTKIQLLVKQFEENVRQFKEVLHKKDVECSRQIAALQANYSDIMLKLKQVNQELEMTKSCLRRYKAAYTTLNSSTTRIRRHSPTFAMDHIPSAGLPSDIFSEGLEGINNTLEELYNC